MLRPSLTMLSLVIAACSSPAARPRCLVGASLACACADGRSGAQICQEGNTLGPCSCTSSTGADAGVPDVGVPDLSIPDANPADAAGATCFTGAAPATCADPVESPLYPTDDASLVSLIAGRWLACSCVDPSRGLAGMVGLEFTSDQRFYLLYADSDSDGGNVVRGGDFGDQGTYRYADSGTLHMIELQSATGGSGGSAIVFSASPRKMQMGSFGQVVFATGE